MIYKFQSTLPARGATIYDNADPRLAAISIHAPRTGSDPRDPHQLRLGRISIHAPRTGSDSPRQAGSSVAAHFNPRSPHGERPGPGLARKFRAAISIHAPRTGSDATIQRYTEYLGISIHAPRTGSDERLSILAQEAERLFQSTLPARGATVSNPQPSTGCINFNPRSPHGERRDLTDELHGRWMQFQSTLPARGATAGGTKACTGCEISIHAPRTGSDLYRAKKCA